MSILPSQKLILWASFFLPTTLLAGIYPWVLYVVLNWLLLILFLSGIDWMISRGFPEQTKISLPSEISLIQNKGKEIYLNLANTSRHPL